MSHSATNSRERPAGNIKIIWLIALAIVLAFGIFRVLPTMIRWQETREKVALLEKETSLMELELKAEKTRHEEVQKKFQEEADPFLKEEKQLYPKKIDTNKIAKILELFSLNETIVNGRNSLIITNLTFGVSNDSKTQTQSTRVSLSMESDSSSLRSFVQFLQSSDLPPSFETTKEQTRSPINTSEYQFLKNNLLPVVLIDSIKSAPLEAGSHLLKTTIQLRFFSQG